MHRVYGNIYWLFTLNEIFKFLFQKMFPSLGHSGHRSSGPQNGKQNQNLKQERSLQSKYFATPNVVP